MTVDLIDARARWEGKQLSLWGQRPRDWAELAEPQNLGLIASALDAGAVSGETALLDVGCGSGLALAEARARGAAVAGIDIAASLLAIAAERVPDADLRQGGLDELPFPDDSYDVVLAINALQFAFDSAGALGEIVRVLRLGGRLVIAQFAAPDRCESTVLHDVMETLVPAETHEDHAPYALSVPGAMESALQSAGLTVTGDRELPGDWHYSDQDAALAGLLCSGGGTRAIAIAGEDRVRTALTGGLERFRQSDGSFLMHNHFRLLVAERSPGESA
jgi:SAM-dependent methyltransferase